jgi:tetratricopeptide (TPR) repeat protein
MKLKFSLLLALAPLFVFAQNAHQRMDFAKEKLKQNDTVAALAYYEQAIRLEPRNGLVYATRGQLYQDMKNYKEAKADFDRAILLDPKEAKYYNYRALLFNIAGYYEYVIKDADKAIELAGDSLKQKSFGYYLRAKAKSNLNAYDAALADFDSALANQPESGIEIGSLISSSIILGHLKKHNEAIARLQTLIAKYPDFTSAYNNLGFQYMEIGQYKEAVQTYDKVISILNNKSRDKYTMESGDVVITNGTEMSLPLNNRGYAKYKLGDNKAALKDINASLELAPGNSYAYKNRALVYIATKKKKKACADLQKALDSGFTNAYGNEVQQLMDEHCK